MIRTIVRDDDSGVNSLTSSASGDGEESRATEGRGAVARTVGSCADERFGLVTMMVVMKARVDEGGGCW